MTSPLSKIKIWLEDERGNGNVFPQGAVLSTVSKDGAPRSRVVSTMLDKENIPKFHTSPITRKVDDIAFNNKASLTYSFQRSLRSISIEGSLTSLNNIELDEDWLKFDEDFRRHYTVFGECSGHRVDSLTSLREKRDIQPLGTENIRPSSFIGFKFSKIDRISFYSVREGDFASSILYEKRVGDREWSESIIVP